MGGKEMTLLIVLTEADNYDDRMIGRAIVPRETTETTRLNGKFALRFANYRAAESTRDDNANAVGTGRRRLLARFSLYFRVVFSICSLYANRAK